MKKLLLLLAILAPVKLFAGTVTECRTVLFDKNDPAAADKFACAEKTAVPLTGHYIGHVCYNRSTSTIYLEGRKAGAMYLRFTVGIRSVWPVPVESPQVIFSPPYTSLWVDVAFTLPADGECKIYISEQPPIL